MAEGKRFTKADLEKRLEAMIAESGGRDAPLVSSTLHAEVRELQKRNKEQAEQRAKNGLVAPKKKEEPKKETPARRPVAPKPKKQEAKREEPKKETPRPVGKPENHSRPAKTAAPPSLGDALRIPYKYRRTADTIRAINRSTRRDKKIR